MNLLKKLLVMSLLLVSSFSAFAYGCVLGGYGYCIWGVDKKEPENIHLIDPTLFLEFCDKNNIYCLNFNNGYNSIMGRFLNDEVFLIADKAFGGPDVILDNKEEAEQFAKAFKGISKNPEALFFIKNDSHPTRNILAIGYREMTKAGYEEVKLLVLPNEWGRTGGDYTYVPPDE